MNFDMKKFAAAKWTPRSVAVPTPDLKPWFKEGVAAAVTIRNLDGPEIARANEIASQASAGRMEAVVEALTGGNAEVAEAVKEILGTSDRVPADHLRRLELLQIGCVEPVFDLRSAQSLAKHLPTTFLILTNKILELTGLGSEPGKPKGSGKKKGSGPQ